MGDKMKNNTTFFIGEIDLGDTKDIMSIVCIPKNPISNEIIAIQYFKYIATVNRDGKDIIIMDHYTYNCLENEKFAFSCFREENKSTVSSKPEIDKEIFEMLYEFLNNRDFNFKSAEAHILDKQTQINSDAAKKIIFPLFEEIILKQENSLDNMLSNVCSNIIATK